MNDPDRPRRIAEERARRIAAHDAWCREQAEKHRIKVKQEAIAAQAQAAAEAKRPIYCADCPASSLETFIDVEQELCIDCRDAREAQL